MQSAAIQLCCNTATLFDQVDSVNTDSLYGAVLENHEIAGEAYNNISSNLGFSPASATLPPANTRRTLSSAASAYATASAAVCILVCLGLNRVARSVQYGETSCSLAGAMDSRSI
jgi:hypothetical protein